MRARTAFTTGLILSGAYLACRIPFWIEDIIKRRPLEPLSSDGEHWPPGER